MKTTLTKEVRDHLAVSILTDAVIFERTYNGMNEIMKASDPKAEDWDAGHKVNSFANAFPLMINEYSGDWEDEQITDKLSDVFFKFYNEDKAKPFEERKEAQDLAKHIFIDWLSITRQNWERKVLNTAH